VLLRTAEFEDRFVKGPLAFGVGHLDSNQGGNRGVVEELDAVLRCIRWGEVNVLAEINRCSACHPATQSEQEHRA